MATAFGARFRRGPSANPSARGAGDERVGEILSDSSDSGSSGGGAAELKPAIASTKPATRSSKSSSLQSSGSSDSQHSTGAAPRRAAPRASSSASDRSGQKAKATPKEEIPKVRGKTRTFAMKKQPAGASLRGQSSRTTASTRRSGGRKWYSDSDASDDEVAGQSPVDKDKKNTNTKSKPTTSTAGRPVSESDNLSKKKSQKGSLDGAKSDADADADSDLDAYISGSMMTVATPTSGQEDKKPSKKLRPKLKRLTNQVESPRAGGDNSSEVSAGGILSPTSESGTPRGVKKDKSSFLKLMAKTRMLSPFGGQRKRGFGDDTPASPAADSPSATTPANTPIGTPEEIENRSDRAKSESKRDEDAVQERERRVLSRIRGSDAASIPGDEEPTPQTTAMPNGNRRSARPSAVTTSGVTSSQPVEITPASTGASDPVAIVNRRTNRLKRSESGSDYSSSPRQALAATDAVISPGPRKVPGAFPGKPGSGVLLEGWLRQKQRRGLKGFKQWNARYFVLYARANEVRYYTDVVQSAWGPLPLGEVGAISLRLIHRIGKPSHPKYKGCRFDITCRNSWGTHYADDYVSSDDENASANNNNNSNENENENEQVARASASAKQEKGGTPHSSRVYSLLTDSPQVTATWFNMLDSLLTRSANSPRPDVSSLAEGGSQPASTNSSSSGRAKKPRSVARQRSGALDSESAVLLAAGEHVPKAVIYSINFIFDSTPGIETERFYELEPEADKLRSALKFLNQFAGEPMEGKKPSKEELDAELDAVTAGAVVYTWLQQLDQPLVPLAMYADFCALAREAQTAPFDLRRNLRALLEALPKKNLVMLACLLFHLNDVSVYSSKNGMDAARLALRFAQFVLRPQTPTRSAADTDTQEDAVAVRSLVEELVANVDTFIDEKEAQVLEDHRL